jgi:class 3 adenylate cyclase/tetratricopeptide (TPR) repeat protein
MSSVETVSVLFTDAVASTALEERVGPDRARAALFEHFSVLREAIAFAGGREVKSLGDGLMVVFSSAVAAVRCAVQMQQLIERRNREAADPVAIRIGVSLGDVTRGENDYFGEPVVQAARLCALAAADQILCSDLVRLMAGARAASAFSPVGELELKGLSRRLAACEVVWTALDSGSETAPLPAALDPRPQGFVGRETERAIAQARWADALAGTPRAVFISGEPGIGKTRLAAEIALAAHKDGAVVLYGRCSEDAGIPYEPWIEALSHYARTGPLPVLRGHVRRHGAELARLVSALAMRVPELPPAGSYDEEAARFSFFAAVRDLLEAVGENLPLVLVLDDLQWADRESLALLRHAVLAQAPRRRLIIGTFRHSDVRADDRLSQLLAGLHREGGVERIGLSGLDEPDVVSLLRTVAGHDLDADGLALAGRLTLETDGNPFFVRELLRHLREQGAVARDTSGRWCVSGATPPLGMPRSVREVVSQRARRLGSDAMQALSVAAIIGRSFELELLARVLRTNEHELLEVLEQAVAASLLRESSDSPGTFTFAHALIEHALYDDISATRRARLHQRVGETLEELYGDDPGSRVGQMAHHFAAAVRPSTPGKVVEYAGRAGRRAIEQLAPAEARRWFEHGLEVLHHAPNPDQYARCELLIGLGEAQRQSGRPGFRRTLLDAAALAHQIGDGDRIARAVLATSRGFGSVARPDDELIVLLRAARDALPGEDPRRARVLALLASELTFTTHVDERRALVDHALELARANGDQHTLAFVLLYYVFALWYPDTLSQRLEACEEMVRAARAAGDPPLLFHAAARRCSTVLEAGDLAAADECLHDMRAVVEATPQPMLRWRWLYYSAMRAILAGELQEALARARESGEVGTGAGERDAHAFQVTLECCVRWERGELEDAVGELAQAIDSYPGFTIFRPLYALALCEAGQDAEAEELLNGAAADGFGSIPSNALWTTAMMTWSQVAARLDDRRSAELLYERLKPFADQVAVTPIGIPGAIAHGLGLLADTLRLPETAERHFTEALEIHARLRAPLLMARTRAAMSDRASSAPVLEASLSNA